MPLPSTTYDTATLVNPTSALTDFTLMVDLSRMSAAWWAAVDTSDGTKGRAAKDDGTELAVDWIDFDDIGETGWARVKWSGTLAASGSQTLRIYPPMAANASVAASDTYGSDNAYDADWLGYWPLGDLSDRTANGLDLTAFGSPTSGVASKVGDGYTFDGSTQYLLNNGGFSLAQLEYTLMVWVNPSSLAVTQPTAVNVGSAVSSGEGYLRSRITSGTHRPQINPHGGSAQDDAGSVTTGAWQHFGAVTTATTIESFYNGAGSGSPGTYSATPADWQSVAIGCRVVSTIRQHHFAGTLNEAQVHTVARSAAWIEQEYDQTNDQVAFFGTWTNNPVASGRRRAMVIA